MNTRADVIPFKEPRSLAGLAANLPAVFLPNEKAGERFFGFFTAHIRNRNTRRAYYKAACRFVLRCQNDDGGFHFIYDDPTRNKAGVANADPLLFHSYGSTTADGLHALALCDDPADEDRRKWARDWLLTNFRADRHPGTYVTAHEPTRDAVYFYYAAGAARAFRDHKLALPDGRDWHSELSYALAARQAKDGSWTNPVELVRENDPLVATSSAVLALARCRAE